MTALPRVCVVGAGPSGIAAAKALADRGVPFECYEMSDRVGGLWVFENASGRSPCYEHLYSNTSKLRTQYADFPMPADFPDYPHHRQMAAYLDAYADHFGLRERITFCTTVERATLHEDGTWSVALDGAATERFDALVVANGHHWDPRWPEPLWPGEFDGEIIHAHDYRRAAQLQGRDVVVVGMGNSAMDIVAEAAHHTNRVVLSARRGAWVLPKYILGRPLDQIPQDPRVPFKVRQRVSELLVRLLVGSPERYGLRKPDHRLMEAHPTISGDLHNLLAHGAITPKPDIARLAGERVEFEDGTSTRADLIVCCTGYRISFPFLDPSVLAAPDNRIALYLNVFKPGLPSLAVVGLLQVLGSVIPLSEQQAKLVGDYLVGVYALPPQQEMVDAIRSYQERMARRYVASQRHTIQVDQDAYLRELARERAAGARRAAALGNPLPVPGRAAVST